MQDKFSQNDIFSYRLKTAIKSSGLKQKEIAKRMGVSEITISRYCAGTQAPSTANLHLLSSILNVPISALVDNPTTTHIPTAPSPASATTSLEQVDWKRRALAAEERLQRIETILHELFAFARIGQ